MGAGTIHNDKDVVDLMTKGISGLSGFMVLIFFAAQFTNFFTYSNLGTILSVAGANFLENIGFVGLPLIVALILLTAIINLFVAVDSAKWAIMAPVFVPMFMRLGMSPELTQVAYRIGDSCTNIITPMMSYYAMIIVFAKKLRQGRRYRHASLHHAALQHHLFAWLDSPAGGVDHPQPAAGPPVSGCSCNHYLTEQRFSYDQ